MQDLHLMNFAVYSLFSTEAKFLFKFSLILNLLFGLFWVKVTKVFMYFCIFQKLKQINYKLQEHETFLLSTKRNAQLAYEKHRDLLGVFGLSCLPLSAEYTQYCEMLANVNCICIYLECQVLHMM
jgi:hypothetical protein